MKKLFLTLVIFATTGLLYAAITPSSFGVDFAATTSNGADGIESWTGTAYGSGSGSVAPVLGVTCTWLANGTWTWGPDATDVDKIYYCHLEDAMPITLTITGLDSWLNDLGKPAYYVRVYRNTNQGGNVFPPFYVSNTVSGVEVDTMTFTTFTDGNAFRSVTNSVALSADSISLTSTEGEGGGFARAQTAGIAVVAIPEPTSIALIGLCVLGLLRLKK